MVSSMRQLPPQLLTSSPHGDWEQDLQKPDARHCKKFEGFMFVFCRGCGEVLHLPANFLEHFHVDDAIVPCVLHPCKPFAR